MTKVSAIRFRMLSKLLFNAQMTDDNNVSLETAIAQVRFIALVASLWQLQDDAFPCQHGTAFSTDTIC